MCVRVCTVGGTRAKCGVFGFSCSWCVLFVCECVICVYGYVRVRGFGKGVLDHTEIRDHAALSALGQIYWPAIMAVNNPAVSVTLLPV